MRRVRAALMVGVATLAAAAVASPPVAAADVRVQFTPERRFQTEGNMPFVAVRLTAPAPTSLTVDYATVDATALAGSDYTPLAGTLTFPTGFTSGSVRLTIANDGEVEPDEVFFVELSNPSPGLALGRVARLEVNIFDDDSGRPIVTCPSSPSEVANIVGTDGDDVLVGTDGHDVIVAGSGNDTIEGLNGDDLLCGGLGADTVYGGGGDDVIYDFTFDNAPEFVDGGGGDDEVVTQNGDDQVYGGAGNDQLCPRAGDDFIDGGAGDDVINDCGAGPYFDRDEIAGGPGNDLILEWGDDIVTGGSGDDHLINANGWAPLGIPNGNASLSGGLGNDILEGGLGSDRLSGGAGTDTCVADPEEPDAIRQCEA